MGLRFHKGFKIAPGVRANLSGKSAGISVGVEGCHLSVNTRGQLTGSIGIPGTGLYWRKTLTLGSRSARKKAASVVGVAGVVLGHVGPRSHRAYHAGVRALHYGDPGAAEKFEEVLRVRRSFCSSASFLAAFTTAGVDKARAVEHLRHVLDSRRSLPDRMLRLHHPRAEVTMDITPAVKVTVPVSRAAAALLFAELMQEQGNLQSAVEAVEEALRASPEDTTLRLSLSELHWVMGKPDDVIVVTTDVKSKDDPRCQMLIFRACAFASRGEWTPALCVLKEALGSTQRSNRVRAAALYERAQIHLALGDRKAAHKDFAAAYALQPEYLDVRERMEAPSSPPISTEQTAPLPSGGDDADPAWILRKARRRARLTQRELALRAGVSYLTVANTESGKTKPKPETMRLLLETCAAATHEEPPSPQESGPGTAA